MKKVIALLLLVVMIFSLAACKSKFTCDACQKEVESSKNNVEVFGVEMVVCDDCYKEYEDNKDVLDGLGDSLGDMDLGDLEDALGDLGDLG